MVDDVNYQAGCGFYYKDEPIVGIVQATVLPPESIFVPCLPVQSHGKLKFGLCRKCMNTQNPNLCKHSNKDRCITSSWVSTEVDYAISECGYKLVKVHEFFAYEKQQPFFKNFYTRLARQKIEAQGFPHDAMTDAEKIAYAGKINEEMPGLDLDWRKIEKNDGKRQFAKDMSNVSIIFYPFAHLLLLQSHVLPFA